MKTESVDELFKRMAKDDKELARLIELAEDELEKELQARILVDEDFKNLYESEQKKLNSK